MSDLKNSNNKSCFMYDLIFFFWVFKRRMNLYRKYIRWKKCSVVIPMPYIGKYYALLEYVNLYKPQVFIETGTYKADMVCSMKKHFDQIYSIELDEELFRKAEKLFSFFKNIHILHGSSDELLPGILKDLNSPALFWLDAHSAPNLSPIMSELKLILNHPLVAKHVICIDDARSFNGTRGYPTIEQVKDFIHNIYPGWIFEVRDDIIRVHNNKMS